MNRGVVLSADLDSIIVFTADCKIIRLPNRHNVKIGQEINIERPAQKQKSRSLFFKPMIAFALALVAVFSGLLIAHNVLQSRTYAILSIDVNPSVQFSLNKDLVVTDVIGLNEDALSILNQDDYIGLTWDQASVSWFLTLDNNGYDMITDVLISAVVPDKDNILIPQITLFESQNDLDFLSDVNIHVYYTHDLGVAQDAQFNGLSVGHQMLVNRYMLMDNSWSIDRLNDRPLGEMVRILAQNGGINQTETTMPLTVTPADTRPGTSDTDHPTDTIPSNPRATESGGPPETIPSNPRATESGGPPETIPSNPRATESGGPPDTIPSNPRATESGGPPETIPSNPRATESGGPPSSVPSNSRGGRD